MTYKFRGISVYDNQFVYGSLIKKRNGEYYIQDDNGLGSDIVTESISPYIGRNDDNGREMYNSDTVKVDCSGVGGSFNDGVYRIEYSEVDCAFFLVQLDGKHAIAFNECYGYEAINPSESKYVELSDLGNKTVLELSDLDGKTIKARISVTKYSPKISID